MREAARRGRDVVFIETGGFLGRHLWHLIRRQDRRSLLRRLALGESTEPRVRVRKALNFLPWGQRFAVCNTLNAAINSILLRRTIGGLSKPCVLWTYDPCWARVIGRSREDLAVYDCVDDYAAASRSSRKDLVLSLDRLAAKRSNLVFTTSEGMYHAHLTRNPRTFLVPSGHDGRHFAIARDRSNTAFEVRDLPRPVVGFAGNLIGLKVDFDLLEEMASERSEWTFLLIGPVQDDARESVERLASTPNVIWIGHRSYLDLPRYIAAVDVGMIPYVENEYTRSCVPLKLYEYLAAGKPVVASGLPELERLTRELGPELQLADDAASFIAAIERAIKRLSAEDCIRRTVLAAGKTWTGRMDRLDELVMSELEA